MDAREEKAAARSRWKKNQAYNYSKNKHRKKVSSSGNDSRRDTEALAAVELQPGTVALQGSEEQSFQPGQSSSDEGNYYDEEGSGGDYEEWLNLYPAEPVAVLMRKRLALPDGDLLQFVGLEEDGLGGSSLAKKENLDTHINLKELENVIGSIPMVTALDIGSDLQELMFGDATRAVDSDVPPQSKELEGHQVHTESIATIERPVLETNDDIYKEISEILRIDDKYSGGNVDDILRQTTLVVDGRQTAPAAAHLEADDQELDDFLDSLT
jgi:hypothetical protein